MANLWGIIPGVDFANAVGGYFNQNPIIPSTNFNYLPKNAYGAETNPSAFQQSNNVAPGAPGNYNISGGTLGDQNNKSPYAPGSTLGARTGGGGGGGSTPTPQPQQPSGPSAEERARQEFESRRRGEIDNMYSGYFGELDNMLNVGLPGSRSAQEGIIGNQYNTGMEDLGLQKTQGMDALGQQRVKAEEQQVKTLRDISGNIRNSMQAGNIYLGTRGAGDSSAANQYAYALAKMGTQQRGETMNQTGQIMNDIGARETNLKNIYDTETRKLSENKNMEINKVALWFNDATNQIRQAKANGQLAKGQDLATLTTNIFNQAMQELNNIKSVEQQKRSQLETWAMNNSTNIQQLKANMSQIGAFQAPGLEYTAFDGRPNAGGPPQTSPYYPGATIGGQEDKDIFGGGYPYSPTAYTQ